MFNEMVARVPAMWEILSNPPQRMGVVGKVKRRLNFILRQRQIESSIRNLHATGIVTNLKPFRGVFELQLSNAMTRRLLLGGYESTQQALM